MKKTILSRFSFAYGLLLLTSILALGIFFLFFSNRFLQSDRLETLDSCAINAQNAYNESINDNIDLPLEEKRSRLRENLRLITNTSATKMLLADETGRVIVCTEEQECEHEGMYVPAEILSSLTAVDGSVQIHQNFADMYTEGYYTIGMAARNRDGEIIGYIFAFSDSTRTAEFISSLMAIFIFSAGVMLSISSMVTVAVTGRLTTPLRSITDAARKFARGDFSARASVDGDDEVAQAAYTFNQMASFVEKNEQSRSSFVANVAHELRTPMTSIKGFVDGIRDGTIPAAEQKRYLDVISEEVGRLSRLTNSMLDMSKLESGEFNMNVRVYNIWDTIASIAFSLESRIERRNIELRGFEPAKVMVSADKDLIYQVIYNLFDNALKFTPDGGYIAFDVSESGKYVTVKIKNSGQGISAEALPFVFDRFYKEDSSMNVHVRGAGIGLYICKMLVQRSGGEIFCQSTEGEYTEFIFTLPSAKSVKKQKNDLLDRTIEIELTD